MATTTTTAAPAASAAMRNPKDSMKSTWRTDKSNWGFFHYMYDILNIYPTDPSKNVPVHAKTDKVPNVPEWTMHRHILLNSFTPLLIHQAIVYFTGHNLNIVSALILYTLAFKLIGIHQLQQLRSLGAQCGFFDGDKHARDEVPDHSVVQVFLSLINTSTFRSVFTILLAYRKDQTPFQMAWLWLPLEQGMYGIILDFWFYWYHRVMHEYDGLWKFHRTHHLTKHPNPLLTLYADHEQELFDIAGIPLMTYGTMKLLGFPMGFYEWWVCHQYVMFSELSGHSGLRINARTPNSLGWLLKIFDCELVIEDHDLHHRKGWKKSGNYGKQTRLWDRVFGTVVERIECTKDNIDYENTVSHPLW